jgi:two-component system, NtrC family, nitrogen regulation sensor histidine kinase NtrY
MEAPLPLRFRGKTELRLALIVLATAIVPLVTAIVFARSLFERSVNVWLNPEIGVQLDRGLDVYRDYVRAKKEALRSEADVLAQDDELRTALEAHDRGRLERRLAKLRDASTGISELRVEAEDSSLVASAPPRTPLDETVARPIEVRRSIVDDKAHRSLLVVFAVERQRLDELDSATRIAAEYHRLEASKSELYDGALKTYALLLFATVLLTVTLGTILARGVTRRVYRLVAGMQRVASGDTSARVPVTGSDELTELAAGFNRMVAEVERSRSTIAYLERVSAWQEMAQRLAHEIKNPLTPIQLAIEECHRRYGDENPAFRRLLDTTLEVVEEEVATLRRLVESFSNFARMPSAELEPDDLARFLRETKENVGTVEGERDAGESSSSDDDAMLAAIEWRLPKMSMPVLVDRQLLRRVLINLVRNAAQALHAQRRAEAEGPGRIVVRAENLPDGYAIVVEDNGPGVPEPMRERIFDPYVTSKEDGDGLGLAIAKKIVVEHGGALTVDESRDLGGAAFTLRLPLAERAPRASTVSTTPIALPPRA